ncbi:MAG: glycosyltransferase family 2 protein [Candidatus Aenigmatarchaeota archaeon]
MKKISIVVPTFNEEKNIGKFLEEIKKLKLKNYEVIIVDDSFDNTAKVAKLFMKKLKICGSVIKRFGKRGKGSAIRDGLKLAKGKYIVLIDADLQYPVEKIPNIVEKLKEYDIVNTKRLRKDPFYRKILGKIFRILVFVLFNIKEETQSTMRGFRKEVKEKIEFEANSWAWDVEFLYKAKKIGFKSINIPIIYGERKIGKSKINFITPFKMFLEILKIRLRLL